MLITPHLLVGVAIGAKIRHFGWIIVLGLLSHLILDKIPHWDYGQKIEKLPRDKNYKKVLLINLFKMLIDGLMGLIIILPIIWLKDLMKAKYFIFILAGILASLLPDFILGVTKLFYHKSKFSKSYTNFHHKFLHHSGHITKPTLLGLGTEIIVSIVAILILLI